MNVIGIIQTDLNEFNVLFEQQGGQGGNGQGQQSHDGGQNHQQDQDSDSMFLSFLDEQPSSNEQSGQGNSQGGGQGGQQQNGPQELTVRIKGIPEGQKANFLQMYQILQDAQDSQTLEKDLTIVDHGDQDQGAQKQGQGHGSGKQNKTTH
ncbi:MULTISPECIES: hypothetical protein [Brevibacillus]|uniref:hypothetical protein n=1 Tax=Brevibacillus TaxID=55080 RepID=UPI00156BD9C7|nr:hypothetical protein [Brevibacillus sp. RS1.1]NRR01299.1 hypothetical protein [Brevibacillus sp. RS1.1]